jgi:hypothetical protein
MCDQDAEDAPGRRSGAHDGRCDGERTSGARAFERDCARMAAGRGRGLRGVMEDVGEECFEKELTARSAVRRCASVPRSKGTATTAVVWKLRAVRSAASRRPRAPDDTGRARVSDSLGGRAIVKQSRATYASPDGSLAVVALCVARIRESGIARLLVRTPCASEAVARQGRGIVRRIRVRLGTDIAPRTARGPRVLAAGTPYHRARRHYSVLACTYRTDGDSFTLSAKEGVPKRDISKYLLPAEHRAAVAR